MVFRPSCRVAEPYSLLASCFSHSLVLSCLHVAHLWGIGHPVNTVPLGLLPHRCLLYSHGCVYIFDFTEIFPFDSETYARTLLH